MNFYLVQGECAAEIAQLKLREATVAELFASQPALEKLADDLILKSSSVNGLRN